MSRFEPQTLNLKSQTLNRLFTLNDSFRQVAEYIPYKHCVEYVEQKSAALPYSGKMQADRLKLMEKCGMKNYSKFYRNRYKWDALQDVTPLAYLESIGVKLTVLEYCLQLDHEAYQEVLKKERKVSCASGLLLGPFRAPIWIPEENGTQEEEAAVAYVHHLMKSKQFIFRWAIIHFHDIIYYEFQRDIGLTKTTWFYPGFEIRNDILIRKTSDTYGGITGLSRRPETE